MTKQAGFNRLASLLMLAAMLAGLLTGAAPTARAASPDIVISQVYGGGGNTGAPLLNDYVELFNRGTAAVSLAGWSIQYASATGTGNFGGTSTQITELPAITVQPGQYVLVQEASGGANGVPLPTPDVTDATPINMSSTGGKVVVARTNVSLGCNGGSTPCPPEALALIVDLVGWDGANFFETAPAPATSSATAIFRANNGCVDTDNNAADFALGAPAPRNTASAFFSCVVVLPTDPTGVGAAAPASLFAGESSLLTVTVTPGDNPPSTGLSVSGDLSAIGGGAAQSFFDDASNGDVTAGDNVFSFLATVDAATTAGAKTLPFSISDAEGRSGSGAISLTVQPPLISIHDIQGAAHLSPMNAVLVSTQGIVTARARNGFYMQETAPDADEATSEGLFVFTLTAPPVSVGDFVLVTGTVKEFRPGGSGGLNNLTTTEIDNPGRTVTVLSNGNPLPPATVIGLGGRMPPTAVIEDDVTGSVEDSGVFDPAFDGIDFYESMEGMFVQVNNAVATGPTNNFGEISVIGDGGSWAGQRTNRGGIVVQPGDFNPERLILDDTLFSTPRVNTGDTITETLGVMDYSFGNFKLYVTATPAYADNGLAQEVAPGGPEYQLAVATFNVENLDALDAQTKFDELAELVVNHLLSPDILALEEIQDNNGPLNDAVVDADQTLARLIAAIQAAGGPLYEYRQINPVDDQDGGEPGGNIRVGFLFNPARVSFVDRAGGDSTSAVSVVAGASGPELSFSPGRIDPLNVAFDDSRKPLAGEFLFRGDRVFVVANHFNSKGGDTPLFGRYQPPVLNSEVQRLLQAQAVHDFAAALFALDPDANLVVLGDLNDFEFSAPLTLLKGGILNALIETLPVAERYTYVFNGNSQTLDHILVSNRLLGVPFGYDVLHVNAEFSAQVSDHDPQVAYVCADNTAPALSVKLSRSFLWPPDHKLYKVIATVTASDNADPAPLIELVSVTSNEPDDGLGDGDTPNDIVIEDDFTFWLRAERAGVGSGRVYTITYRATDACGNSTLQSAIVRVTNKK
ncbi:MAG: lamin tail domain-containing protein [Chloroflexi bacterium]|nr:lamin tail domain-containing protein [Chloroflexota bacterium]